MGGITDENYEALANAIILSAISDYKSAHKKLKKVIKKKEKFVDSIDSDSDIFLNYEDYKNENRRKRNNARNNEERILIENLIQRNNYQRNELSRLDSNIHICKYTIEECRNFLLSPWFDALSDSNGDMILNEINNDLIKKGYLVR